MTALWCVLAMSARAAPVQREATVQAVALTMDAAPTVEVTVRIAPNRARVPSVGIMELASGTGDQWLTTLWQAAFIATQATNSSLLDFEFTLRVAGAIDGPSAGLLTTSTLAALIKGKKVLPHTTLTGSINPDGSVGPVGGVLQRLRGAAAGGVKRFGFPLGGRQQVDASGEVTDLLVEGKKLGVEVKELGGLDDAFLFLTGQALPRPAPVSEAEMELWPVELAGLTRLTSQVRRDFTAEQPQLDEALTSVEPKRAAVWKERLARSTQGADDFAKNGDTVRAMVVWSSTLTTQRVATQDARLVRSLDARDTAAVFAALETQEAAVSLERKALRATIDAQFPNTTRANDVYAMDLLESVVTQGLSLRAEATAKELRVLSTSEEGAQAFKRLARQHAEDLLRVREELENGRRFVALYASLPPLKKSIRAVDAARLAPWYVSAGAASRAALEARAVKNAFEQDSTWLDLVGYAALLGKETDARARLVLAARQTIYSAYLVNTYDALGGQLDEKGTLSIRNARALSAQLDLARLRVLQSCGQAKRELGIIPFPARMRFLNARAAREGSDRQKADALADLWVSNWWCEFAVRDRK
ncbi:MAG: S16 family serine protease [Archangium sp.]|nr:S16 family serine protease [Archangium sp.]